MKEKKIDKKMLRNAYLMVSELGWQIIVCEFDPHWVPHTSALVLSLVNDNLYESKQIHQFAQILLTFKQHLA